MSRRDEEYCWGAVMIRAGLKLCRRISCAAILLVLIVCAFEVGVRTYELTCDQRVCPLKTVDKASDPTGLAIPSWSTNLELKPFATADIRSRDSRSTIEIRTNSLGLRGPEVVVPKPASVFRIVILGDETVIAPEIALSDHFAAQLETMLRRVGQTHIEVINAGLPGGCPLTEYVFFKQRLLSLQPDLVLLHYDWSDVSEDQQLRRRTHCGDDGLPLSCPHASLVAKKQMPHPLDTIRQQFRLVDWGLSTASVQWKQQIAIQTAASQEAGVNPYAWMRNERLERSLTVEQSFHPIADLARLGTSLSFRVLVVTSPKPWQISPTCSSGKGTRLSAGVAEEAYYPSRAPFDSLADYTSRMIIPYADVSMALMSGPDPDRNYLRYSPRWSREGHRKVAEFLARFISERVAGPWNSRYLPHQVHPIGQRPHQVAPVQWASGQR